MIVRIIVKPVYDAEGAGDLGASTMVCSQDLASYAYENANLRSGILRIGMAKERNQWVYTLLGYVIIAFGVVLLGALIVGATYWVLVVQKESLGFLRFWTLFSCLTLMIIVIVIKRSRCLWYSRIYWATLISLLAIHSGFFLIVRHNAEEWKGVWFYLICAVETPLFLAIVTWTTKHFGRRYGSEHSS
jgi:hypothetical protein